MSWTNVDYINSTSGRVTEFCNCLVLSAGGLDSLASEQATIFDNTFKFTDQISGITYFPLPPLLKSSGLYHLRIEGVEYRNITVAQPDVNKYYNLGQYTITSYYNNFADYNGYTELRIFLPFLGTVDLDINEFIDKVLQVRLIVDYYTGKGLYVIGVSNSPISHEISGVSTASEDANMRIVSTFETDIGIDIPMGQSSLSDFKRNLAMATLKTAAALSVPELAIPIAMAPTPMQTQNSTAIALRNNNEVSTLFTVPSEKPSASKPSSNTGFNMSEVFDASVSALNRTRLRGTSDRVSDSGLTSLYSGKPKLVFYRPKIHDRGSNFNHMFGKPLGEVRQLYLVHGYTIISKAHFEGSGFGTATAEEISLIDGFFSSGVILP